MQINCMQYRFGTGMASAIACDADLEANLAARGTLQLTYNYGCTTTPSIRGTQWADIIHTTQQTHRLQHNTDPFGLRINSILHASAPTGGNGN